MAIGIGSFYRPSHTSLITGVRPAVHGIIDNRILDPEGRSNAAWYWYARQIQAPTLVGAARARGLRAGAVSWPVTVGLDADYNVPEFWRSSHPESLILLKAMSTPADLLDTIEIAEGRPFGWPQNDRHRTTVATHLLRTRRPDLLLLHLIELDGAQHTYGPGTPEATKTLETIDGYIGEIVDAIAQAGVAGRTHVVIVSDDADRADARQAARSRAVAEGGSAAGDLVMWHDPLGSFQIIHIGALRSDRRTARGGSDPGPR